MSKITENQDNGLFTFEIEPEPKKRAKSKKAGNQAEPIQPISENKPIDNPESGMIDANIINDMNNDICVISSNNISDKNNGENQGKSGKEIPFDAKELKFLELYLIAKESKTNAMNLAGYENYSDQWKRHIGSKIVERYETWAGDARIVFRKAGVGEVRLARTVDKLLTSKNEKTLLGASELTAKVLRASQDPGDTRQGINIIINTSTPCAPAPLPGQPAGPGPTVEVRVTQEVKSLKPLAITK